MKERHPIVQVAYIIATGFGSGLAPKAPGTMGTAMAAILSYFYTFFFSQPGALGFLVFLIIATFISLISIEISLQNIPSFEEKDPQKIVIDEFAGYLVALSFCPWTLNNLILAFILFRLFDITKPWVIGWADKLEGSIGIILDDLIAGFFAALCLVAIDKFF